MLWGPESTRVALAGLAAAHHGLTVPIEWAASADEAIAAAEAGDTIAIIPADHLRLSQLPELDLIGQYPLDSLHFPWAVAVGRLSREAAVPVSVGVQDTWHPSSWKTRVHQQLPSYSDRAALEAVEARLAGASPVVLSFVRVVA